MQSLPVVLANAVLLLLLTLGAGTSQGCTPQAIRAFAGGNVEYYGCFTNSQLAQQGQDEKNPVVYQGESVDKVSIDACKEKCKPKLKHGIMGLSKDKCWCQIKPNSDFTSARHLCSNDCSGNSQDKCGDESFVATYTY